MLSRRLPSSNNACFFHKSEVSPVSLRAPRPTPAPPPAPAAGLRGGGGGGAALGAPVGGGRLRHAVGDGHLPHLAVDVQADVAALRRARCRRAAGADGWRGGRAAAAAAAVVGGALLLQDSPHGAAASVDGAAVGVGRNGDAVRHGGLKNN